MHIAARIPLRITRESSFGSLGNPASHRVTLEWPSGSPPCRPLALVNASRFTNFDSDAGQVVGNGLVAVIDINKKASAVTAGRSTTSLVVENQTFSDYVYQPFTYPMAIYTQSDTVEVLPLAPAVTQLGNIRNAVGITSILTSWPDWALLDASQYEGGGALAIPGSTFEIFTQAWDLSNFFINGSLQPPTNFELFPSSATPAQTAPGYQFSSNWYAIVDHLATDRLPIGEGALGIYASFIRKLDALGH